MKELISISLSYIRARVSPPPQPSTLGVVGRMADLEGWEGWMVPILALRAQTHYVQRASALAL